LSVQLHAYSDYSFYRSTFTVERLVERAGGLGIKSLALTDYNTTAGHVELAEHCQKRGIKPIFGVDLAVAFPRRFGGGSAPVVLLAKNNTGYANLLHLTSQSQPLPLFDLEPYAKGLFLLAGGEFKSLFEAGKKMQAKDLGEWYEGVFGDNYYIRLSPGSDDLLNHFPPEKFILSQKACYGSQSERAVLSLLAKIGGLAEPLPPLPFLGWQELKGRINCPPVVVENTLKVAEGCQAQLPKQTALPAYGKDGASFADLVWRGAKARYGQLTAEVRRLVEREVAVVKKMGFTDYFLITAHIVRFAKEAGIPVGPGRGSAASSITAYCLGITDVDPLAWGLLFERFLNEERRNRPDIDLDFCYQRRQEVLDHVAEHFGREHVAQIGTYGTFGPRLARQEVRKVLGNDLKKAAFFEKQIQGLKTHRATHAAGLVITARPLREITAVFQDRTLPVTHLDMYSLEKLGVFKIDLLGLRTLTLLARMEAEVQKRKPDFTLGEIPQADEKTFKLLSAGKSLGIFQLESELYQKLLRQLMPRSLQDLVALLALGRPGPLNIFPKFLELRENPSKISYAHPLLEEILGETYGLILYQEQVMLIACKIGQLSLGEADLLRIALGKNDKEEINKWRRRFIGGAGDFGLKEKEAAGLFQTLLDFSGYAFNKAHSVSYAKLTWAAAYLKANYPAEFFLSLLNEGAGRGAKNTYLLDCQSLQVPLLPPDVSFSEAECRMEGTALRLGFNFIAGLNPHVGDKILNARRQGQFQNFADFKARTALSENVLETLILAGALASLGEKRAHLENIGKAPPSRRRLIDREKELIGFYGSEHPVDPFLPFLRSIKGDLDLAAGEVLESKRSGGKVEGILDTPAGSQYFEASLNLDPRLSKKGALAAFFGRRRPVFLVEMALPLNPILLILPQKEELGLIKKILRNQKGLRPVVLRLAAGVFHPLPSEFWVAEFREVEKRLKQAGIVCQWFDPWKENVT